MYSRRLFLTSISNTVVCSIRCVCLQCRDIYEYVMCASKSLSLRDLLAFINREVIVIKKDHYLFVVFQAV